jgi:hypothetical protein
MRRLATLLPCTGSVACCWHLLPIHPTQILPVNLHKQVQALLTILIKS